MKAPRINRLTDVELISLINKGMASAIKNKANIIDWRHDFTANSYWCKVDNELKAKAQ